MSVIVCHSNLGQCTTICGDLFEKSNDVFESAIWIEAGTESMEKQCKSRERIGKLSDVIIPGHGGRFDVTTDIRDKLTADVNKPTTNAT